MSWVPNAGQWWTKRDLPFRARLLLGRQGAVMSVARYVLVTAVRNEGEFVGRTIAAVASQSHRPECWVIVSDGSTDGTDEIVRSQLQTLPFLRFARRETTVERDFSSKVFAINEGLRHLDGVNYDFIGNLDGDVSFAPDYFATLLARFEADPGLGVAGGLYYEDLGGSWRAQALGIDRSVAGAVQMFRRACWESIGGYLPIRCGGEDTAAEVMARQRGWETRTFRDLRVWHHRRVGTNGGNVLRAFYNMGWREAVIGYHPLFELARILNRMRSAPILIGGLSHLVGYLSAKVQRQPVGLPVDCVAFLRREQLERLRGLVSPKRRR
jgi:biofilm PGA synthesis N-glycosyltransferase PgaC